MVETCTWMSKRGPADLHGGAVRTTRGQASGHHPQLLPCLRPCTEPCIKMADGNPARADATRPVPAHAVPSYIPRTLSSSPFSNFVKHKKIYFIGNSPSTHVYLPLCSHSFPHSLLLTPRPPPWHHPPNLLHPISGRSLRQKCQFISPGVGGLMLTASLLLLPLWVVN
jgi:hypothetical protein